MREKVINFTYLHWKAITFQVNGYPCVIFSQELNYNMVYGTQNDFNNVDR